MCFYPCRDGFCAAELDTIEFGVGHHDGKGRGKKHGKGGVPVHGHSPSHSHGKSSEHFHVPASQCMFGYEQGNADYCTALETSCEPCNCYGPAYGSPGNYNQRHDVPRWSSCVGTPPGVVEANLSPLGPFELLRQSGQWARGRRAKERARLIEGPPTTDELAFLTDHLGDTCHSFCDMQVFHVCVAMPPRCATVAQIPRACGA